jgi:large subunit ribosomal protein L6
VGLSRIGKKPIPIPDGVVVNVEGNKILVRSADSKKKLDWEFKLVEVKVEDNLVLVNPTEDTKEAKAMHGLYRSLIANMIEGIHKGFQRQLEVVGIGYKAEVEGGKLKLIVGFFNPVLFTPPAGVDIEARAATVVVKGIDKQLVGETAARIRRIRPPEPYKGKGIRYSDEVVKKKAAKGK